MSARREQLVRLDDDHRVLSRDETLALSQRIYHFAEGGGETRVQIWSWWQGELRWGRNRVTLASDRRDAQVRVTRAAKDNARAGSGSATTNQLDDISLESAVRAAERDALVEQALPPPSFYPAVPTWELTPRAIWSDATYRLTAKARGEAARTLVQPAEAKELLSAGYIEVRAASLAEMSSLRQSGEYAHWDQPYAAWTHAQCSMTVRDRVGMGSGRAGLSSYDWGLIDEAALAERAVEKCVASRNPVALEPGRYTVILEPQAVCDLLSVLVGAFSNPDREEVEQAGQGPFSLAYDSALGFWRTKLGIKVVDERVTLTHDPSDPMLGIVAQPGRDQGPTTWVDRGVLINLSHDRAYALGKLNENLGVRGLTGYRMSGGDTSVEEMIASAKRALLVTRFSNIRTLDGTSLLSTGLTRDGVWLIENGKISKAVKNFRFTESPLFVLNSIEQLGVPVPVFRPTGTGGALTPAIVPPVKARDFSFTSTIDAI